MRKIAVFTGTRAEYGLLYWLLMDAQLHSDVELQLLVSGAHLAPEFGYTVEQIKNDGFHIDESVEMLLSSDSAVGTAKSAGVGIIGYADALSRMSPDIVVVLGDRYEALAVAQVAFFLRIPLAHIHGGEVTEGAYDDSIRHAITKLSFLHFTSTEEYRRRVIQLGENPKRVFNFGAVGLDHLYRTELLSLEELSHSLDFSLGPKFFLVTYHAATLAREDTVSTFRAMLDALDSFLDFSILITYPNADDGGRKLFPLIEEYARANPARVVAVKSLGQVRYLSALKHSSVVIGNSSSGLIEAPSFGTPTVNIGDRQKGRVSSQTVVHSSVNAEDIKKNIVNALNLEFSNFSNPYGQKEVSSQILNVLINSELDVIKPFFDIELEG